MSTEFNETTVNVVASQGAKIGFVWAAIGISSWTDAAAFLAFVLSLLALSEYLWKKMIRPMLASMGYCSSAKKRVKLVEVIEEETVDE
jgi:hypothetical protein